jgi:Xaa-Pro aminopeptidase
VIEIGNASYSEKLKVLLSDVDKIGFEEDEMTVAQLQGIKSECDKVKFVPTKSVGIEIRAIKDASELKLLQAAADATQSSLHEAYRIAAIGMKEIELCADLEYYLKRNYGAEPAFDFIIASGKNGSMPHAVTGEKKIQANDMVTLDFGAKINKYNSDMTRTFAMGKPSGKLADIYKIVQEAQSAAQESLAPGKSCRGIDKIARDIISKHGYGEFFGHGTGHGVGLNIHESPRLGVKSEEILEEGMVVTVEPGIYLPGIGGVRIENTCYITANGYKSLFDASTDLNIIDGGKL